MKRIVMLGVALALTLALAVPALSAPAKSHRVNATVHAAQVATEGSAGVIAGTLSDATLGKGAIVYKVSGSAASAKVTFVAFSAKGTAKGSGTATITPVAGGGFTFNGTAKATGGTGAFKGITGKLTVTGTEDSSGHITLQATGTVKF